jgi:glutamyl-tRNA(Gln) amidotransferase subunit D
LKSDSLSSEESSANARGLTHFHGVGETLEGYRGKSLALLKRFGLSVGQQIRIVSKDRTETLGLLLPRYHGADDEHIVLKLKSGYNIGVNIASIDSIQVVEEEGKTGESSSFQGQVASKSIKSKEERVSGQEKVVSLLSTGGTIASKIDYVTGAVHPALSAEDLYAAIPELGRIADVRPELLFSIFSEDMEAKHWQTIAEKAIKKAQSGSDGVVIMSGTDILGILSAALSFALLGIDVPVVCVGSQRSSDRPSSDSALNLLGAVRFASTSEVPGVFVAMHASTSDDSIAIHLGTRVRKNHTSRRDAFQSIDIEPFAFVRGDELEYIGRPLQEEQKQKSIATKAAIDANLEFRTRFDSSVSLVKFYPGFNPRILDFLLEDLHARGIILEGTGLGHVSSKTVSKISELTKEGVFVGMTSQCIWGSVDLNVYRTGRDLLQAGVTPLANMLAETALAKLSWALGNFSSDLIKEIMTTNLCGEIVPRLVL